jgi:hypothetical protein
MERSEIIRFWGQDNLRRWSRDDIRDVPIPETSKSFLAEVGLPRHWEPWPMRFDSGADRLPRLPGRPSYRRIGFNHTLPICLDEQRAGCVIVVDDEIGRAEGYINSSTQLFGQFLVYYEQCRLVARGAENRVRDLIAATDQWMRKADPAAFGDDEGWWPVLVEQMIRGFAQ